MADHQPLNAVVNPELMPLLLAFAALRNDDSIHALEDIMHENLKAMEDRTHQLMSSLAKIEEKTMEVHRRVQVEIGSLEVMLAEDLSKMRDGSNAVVLRIKAIKLGNP